jgi:predicted DNA-binding transcriptional regulator YafY
MKTLIIVEADTNDGDYVDRIKYLEDLLHPEEPVASLETIIKVAKAIKKSKQRHNWLTSDYKRDTEKRPEELYKNVLTEDEIDWFSQELTPYGEYGIHTIVSIKILHVESEENLL